MRRILASTVALSVLMTSVPVFARDLTLTNGDRAPEMVPVRRDGTVIDPTGSGGSSNPYPGADYAKDHATQPVSEADGAHITFGTKADAASAATGSTAMSIYRQLHADLIAPTPAGSAVIGKVGIDQTTPGTSNAVAPTNGVMQTLSATAVGNLSNASFSTGVMPVGGAQSVSIGITNPGGVVWELDESPDGTNNWVPVQGYASSYSSTVAPAAQFGGGNAAYTFSVIHPFARIRYLSGSGTLTAALTPMNAANPFLVYNTPSNAGTVATAASQLRATLSSLAYNVSVANGATTPGNAINVVAPYIYSKFNLFLLSTQAGTYVIQGSNDGFATGLTIATGNIVANVALTFTTPITFTSYRGYYSNTSGNAATATALASLTAN